MKKPRFFIPFLILFFIFAIILACNSTESKTTESGAEETVIDESQSEDEPESVLEEPSVEEEKNNECEESGEALNYEIIHTLENARYDGGYFYYILIDPIDINDSNFKDNIKKTISKIVEEKGINIGLDIYDNLEALNYGYEYDTAPMEEWEKLISNEEIMVKLARRCIATFDGNLDTGLYYNTLWFFIYSDHANISEIDKLSEVIEYNPYTEASVVNSGEIEEELEINGKNQQELSSLLEKVKFSCEIQDIYYGELKVVVWVKNDSDKTFSGYIMIEFYDHKNKIIWQDWSSSTWDFETQIPPGQSKYCIMWIPLEKGYPVGIKARVKDYKFY